METIRFIMSVISAILTTVIIPMVSFAWGLFIALAVGYFLVRSGIKMTEK